MYEKKNENENIGQFLILEFFLTYIYSLISKKIIYFKYCYETRGQSNSLMAYKLAKYNYSRVQNSSLLIHCIRNWYKNDYGEIMELYKIRILSLQSMNTLKRYFLNTRYITRGSTNRPFMVTGPVSQWTWSLEQRNVNR